MMDIVERYCKGESSLYHPLVLSYMPLAHSVAQKFGNDEELVSEAYLAMVLAVKEFPQKHRNYTLIAYVRAKIKYALLNFVAVRNTTGFATKTTVYRDKNVKSIICCDLRNINHQHSTPRFSLEVREIIDMVVDNDFEKRILELTACSYTVKDIALELATNSTRVYETQTMLFYRFRMLWNA